MNDRSVKNNHQEHYDEYQNFSFHPKNILLILLLISLTGLFLSLSAAFVYSRVQNNQPPIKLPNIFILNTLILLASSATMVWAKRSYKADNTLNYQRALVATMALSVVFMIAQYFGWRALFNQDIFINSSNDHILIRSNSKITGVNFSQLRNASFQRLFRFRPSSRSALPGPRRMGRK